MRFWEHCAHTLGIPLPDGTFAGVVDRYYEWGSHPAENLGILPMKFDTQSVIDRYEFSSIRWIHPTTQKHEYKAAQFLKIVTHFRPYKRRRHTRSVADEVQLNVHDRTIPTTWQAGEEEPNFILQDWCRSVDLHDPRLRTTFFEHECAMDMLLVYITVLKMATGFIRLTFAWLWSLPEPVLWLYKF